MSDVSPDGKSLLIWLGGRWTICDFPACKVRRTVPVPGSRLHWTPDGRHVAYVDFTGQNIWTQSLDGSPRRVH